MINLLILDLLFFVIVQANQKKRRALELQEAKNQQPFTVEKLNAIPE